MSMLVKYYHWVRKQNNALKFMLIVWGIPNVARLVFVLSVSEENAWHGLVEFMLIFIPLGFLWWFMVFKWHAERMEMKIWNMVRVEHMRNLGR